MKYCHFKNVHLTSKAHSCLLYLVFTRRWRDSQISQLHSWIFYQESGTSIVGKFQAKTWMEIKGMRHLISLAAWTEAQYFASVIKSRKPCFHEFWTKNVLPHGCSKLHIPKSAITDFVFLKLQLRFWSGLRVFVQCKYWEECWYRHASRHQNQTKWVSRNDARVCQWLTQAMWMVGFSNPNMRNWCATASWHGG